VRDRLTTTLFLTAALHLLIVLGVTFEAPRSRTAPGAEGMEVLLLASEPTQAVANPDAAYLAQASQRGAGTAPETRRAHSAPPGQTDQDPTPTLADPDDATVGDTAEAAASQAAAGTTRRRSPAVLMAAESSLRAGPGELRHGATAAAAAAPDTGPVWMSEAGQTLELRGAPHPELELRPDTRESGVAVYLDRWRRHVEEVGSTHYPLQALHRQGFTGNPVLEVQLLASGTLGEVRLLHTSGEPALDRAAMGILHLAVPFEPFPAELLAHHDALRLTYEWQFSGGQLQDTRWRTQTAD
jgi:protein TonB